MKAQNKSIWLLIILPMFLFTFPARASLIQMGWGNTSQAATNTGNISYCGLPIQVNFSVRYSYNDASWTDCNIGGVGSNPYRFKIRLYRNGYEIGMNQFQASACWCNLYFYNVAALAGNYQAQVVFEIRKIWGWRTVETRWSNVIAASGVNASAALSMVNSAGTIQVSSLFGLLTVAKMCLSGPLMADGSASTCESSYFIEIAEFDPLTWTHINTLTSNWICTNCIVPSAIPIVQYLPSAYHLKPGIVYKLKLAVGSPWDSEEVFFVVDCC